jgi:glycerophosphoryl diester phosphodiesterase
MNFKITLTIPFLFLILISCFKAQEYYLTFNSAEELKAFLKYKPERIPLVSAHRGGPAPGYPENCIETFQNAIQHHPAIIECDVALSKDSVLVMMHDDRLDRTTTGSGFVRDFTHKELQALHLEDNAGKKTSYRMPTLKQVLGWAKGKAILTIDVKRGVPFKKIIEAVRENKAEAYSVIITYTANQAKEVYDLDSTLMISASIKGRDDLERLNSWGIENENLVAFVGVSEPDKAVYDFLHEKGIQCILGTMGNLDKRAEARGDKVYYDLISNGADVLSSDRNQEAGKELLKYMKDNNLQSSHLKIK